MYILLCRRCFRCAAVAVISSYPVSFVWMTTITHASHTKPTPARIAHPFSIQIRPHNLESHLCMRLTPSEKTKEFGWCHYLIRVHIRFIIIIVLWYCFICECRAMLNINIHARSPKKDTHENRQKFKLTYRAGWLCSAHAPLTCGSSLNGTHVYYFWHIHLFIF